jgi:hypothetical protein
MWLTGAALTAAQLGCGAALSNTSTVRSATALWPSLSVARYAQV